MWVTGEKEPMPRVRGRRKCGRKTGQKREDGKQEEEIRKQREREGEKRMTAEEKTRAYTWARALCRYAGEDEAFLERFFEMLTASEGVSREFLYYLEHQNFLCGYQVAGYSLIDIMVWQMDHFKAQLDRDRESMKSNGDKMLLEAFHTMLLMEQDPQYYVNLMRTETGTDYEGKYN